MSAPAEPLRLLLLADTPDWAPLLGERLRALGPAFSLSIVTTWEGAATLFAAEPRGLLLATPACLPLGTPCPWPVILLLQQEPAQAPVGVVDWLAAEQLSEDSLRRCLRYARERLGLQATLQLLAEQDPLTGIAGSVLIAVWARGLIAESGRVLLDREDDGWSSYPVAASELTLQALRQEMQHYAPGHDFDADNPVNALIRERKLKLPPNLYLIGTMNTGDESIFFMDSAFKRRWNFEFSPADFEGVPAMQKHAAVGDLAGVTWSGLVGALNALIIDECPSPNLDDKLIGPWFIKAKSTPVRSIEACFPEAFQKLRKLAPLVKTPDRGSNYSEDFEAAFDELLESCDPTITENLRAFAEYNEKSTRKIGLIGRKKSPSGWVYYCSRETNLIIEKERCYIEDFVDRLALQAGEPATGRIGQDDIDGKLFLYLWDNVFDRDKSPISRCLAQDGHALRTFGQFVAQRDAFIAACIGRTVADAAG